VLLVWSFGNGAGLLVQQRVHGCDLTELGGERLDQARLTGRWRQVAALRTAAPTVTWGWPASWWTSTATRGCRL
jgi:hypothetical protein